MANAHDLLMAQRAAMMGGAPLPQGYTRVSYIFGENYARSFRCFIDTGIKPGHDISIEVDAAIDGFDFDLGGFVGCGQKLFSQGGAWYIYFERHNGQAIDQIIRQTSDSSVSVVNFTNSLALGERALFTFNVGLTKEVVIRNERCEFVRFVQAGTHYVENNIGIFRMINDVNPGITSYYYDSFGKLFGAKLWKGSDLIANMIPCVRDADGIAGVYDVVRSLFLKSAGLRNFSLSY